MPLKTETYHDSDALWKICITILLLASSQYTLPSARFVLLIYADFSNCST